MERSIAQQLIEVLNVGVVWCRADARVHDTTRQQQADQNPISREAHLGYVLVGAGVEAPGAKEVEYDAARPRLRVPWKALCHILQELCRDFCGQRRLLSDG